MKEQLKKILLDLIYTPDAKPRFVGGDVESKLTYIDNAVNKITSLVDADAKIDNARHYLCDDFDSELPIELQMAQQIAAIERQAEVDGSMVIDYVDGVLVWEKVEYSITCDEFLDMI